MRFHLKGTSNSVESSGVRRITLAVWSVPRRCETIENIVPLSEQNIAGHCTNCKLTKQFCLVEWRLVNVLPVVNALKRFICPAQDKASDPCARLEFVLRCIQSTLTNSVRTHGNNCNYEIRTLCCIRGVWLIVTRYVRFE